MGLPLRWKTLLGSDQKLACTNTASAASSAFGSATYAILLSCDQNMHIQIGESPTATTSTWLLKSTDPGLILGVTQGQKIAGRCDSAATGNLYIVELTG